MAGPKLVTPLPTLVAHEGAPFGPIDLTEHFTSDEGKLKFFIEDALTAGPLPPGLICTQDGLFGGIPKDDSAGNFSLFLIVENDSAEPLVIPFELTIGPKNVLEDTKFAAQFKSQVWDALGNDLPLPELSAVMARPITPIEIYYLLQRYASFTIWDVNNLNEPGALKLLDLPNMSKHYNIYDRGSCLVGAPKDLFSYERTIADSLQTARVMAGEVFKRNWSVELSGVKNMASQAWVELQVLGNLNDRPLNILHYAPSDSEMNLSMTQIQAKRPTI